MRVDKFLKVSRLIKRRTIAKDACEQQKIFINGKAAKPGSEVHPGDQLTIAFGHGEVSVKVLATPEHVTKDMADRLYEPIS